MKPNRPVQPLVTLVEAASNQITNHQNEFIEISSLRCHFRFVTSRHEHLFVLLNLKEKFFLHYRDSAFIPLGRQVAKRPSEPVLILRVPEFRTLPHLRFGYLSEASRR